MISPPSNPALSSAPSGFTGQPLKRIQPHPQILVLLLALFIGGGAGMGIVTLQYLIGLIHQLTLEDLMGVIAPWGTWSLALVPVLGGTIVSLLRWYSQDFSSPQSPPLVQIGRLPGLSPYRPVTKMVAAATSLGTGASLGQEGPSVEIGANLGLLLSHVMQVSQERQQLLIGAGTAAGFAAGFNAPIAGVFFALEVVLGTTFTTSTVSVVVLAAVIAAWTAQFALGGQPAFALPSYEVLGLWELPFYVGLGVLASIVSLAFTRILTLAQASFKGDVKGFAWLGAIPSLLHPILGGLCVGVVALAFPQVMGVGYGIIEAILGNVEFSLPLLIILLVMKLGVTAISAASGLVGGIYGPLLFLGSALGAAYGNALERILPNAISIAEPPAYAMVGMAAVLAGTVRAPMTAILLLFELTRDYRIVLPLMAAVGLSVWLVDVLRPTDQVLNLQQMGVSLEPDDAPELWQKLRVDAAMQEAFLRFPEELSLIEGGQMLVQQQVRSAIVLSQAGHLKGIVTLQDIDRALQRPTLKPSLVDSAPLQPAKAAHEVTVGEVCTQNLICVYRDDLVAVALDRMASRGLRQLPVIDRDHPEQVIGLVGRESIDLTCRLAKTQQALQDNQSRQVKPV